MTVTWQLGLVDGNKSECDGADCFWPWTSLMGTNWTMSRVAILPVELSSRLPLSASRICSGWLLSGQKRRSQNSELQSKSICQSLEKNKVYIISRQTFWHMEWRCAYDSSNAWYYITGTIKKVQSRAAMCCQTKLLYPNGQIQHATAQLEKVSTVRCLGPFCLYNDFAYSIE